MTVPTVDRSRQGYHTESRFLPATRSERGRVPDGAAQTESRALVQVERAPEEGQEVADVAEPETEPAGEDVPEDLPSRGAMSQRVEALRISD